MILFHAAVMALALAQDASAPLRSEWSPSPALELPADLWQDPKRNTAPETDVFDFDHSEVGAAFTVLLFSTDYKADADFGGTILARAPSPWFSRHVLGLEQDDFGAFFQMTIGHIDRNKIDNLKDSSGVTVFATLGIDYTIYRDHDWFAVADIGIQYGYFGGVTDLHNGVAFLVGLRGGYQVADHWWVTFAPEIAFGNSGDNVYFLHFGAMYSF